MECNVLARFAARRVARLALLQRQLVLHLAQHVGFELMRLLMCL